METKLGIVILVIVQLLLALATGVYLWNLKKGQRGSKVITDKGSRREVDKISRMREISLSEPLSEKTRPRTFAEIVGQEEGLKALRAALCTANPQHVLLYGPPGVGKTAAARLVLEESKKLNTSPFKAEACFIEVDGATSRFDERGIADPLIGSVHDPIYQGAGSMGLAGIPQPKPGAVTRAHGGVLFIDEIGELHPIQLNKLLKVLEDRKVMLESAYYNPDDPNTPGHIHDIFQNGLPADFRLVGATTRSPEEIPPAIRSRCIEVFFRPLVGKEIVQITSNAVKNIEFQAEAEAIKKISLYASNGREAVNMVQIAAGLASTEGRRMIIVEDVEWVVQSGQYNPRHEIQLARGSRIGVVNGLAVSGPNTGMVIELEATADVAGPGKGSLTVTGIVEQEELASGNGHRSRRTSMARNSVENVFTVLRHCFNLEPSDFFLHLNFPGGVPIDGPSAGVSIATALYSAILRKPVDSLVAMTGELSIHGFVKPVGGVPSKVEAAIRAGARRVIIPEDNWQESFRNIPGIEVVPAVRIEDVLASSLTGGGKITVTREDETLERLSNLAAMVGNV